jgi:DNA adenine methylase
MLIHPHVRPKKLTPILKWAGGKYAELKHIEPNLPEGIDRYFEPFVGGGAVYMSVVAKSYFINDKSDELIGLYRSISGVDKTAFFEILDDLCRNWEFLTDVVVPYSAEIVDLYRRYSTDKVSSLVVEQKLLGFILSNSTLFNGIYASSFGVNTPNFLMELHVNIVRKIERMKFLEKTKHKLPDDGVVDNIETTFKSAFYMHFRHIYNHAITYELSPSARSAIFLFIRTFTYSGMFRYNLAGQFNVPYGGIDYNRKNFRKKVEYLKSDDLQELLNQTNIENTDFEDFLRRHSPEPSDFVFLDPPYDTEFSTYAKNEFSESDQARLATYLLNDCRAKWMLVIKNTQLIRSLYFERGLDIFAFDKKYLVSFMNRNDKSAEHLLIKSY